jgi:hypothetical protein
MAGCNFGVLCLSSLLVCCVLLVQLLLVLASALNRVRVGEDAFFCELCMKEAEPPHQHKTHQLPTTYSAYSE